MSEKPFIKINKIKQLVKSNFKEGLLFYRIKTQDFYIERIRMWALVLEETNHDIFDLILPITQGGIGNYWLDIEKEHMEGFVDIIDLEDGEPSQNDLMKKYGAEVLEIKNSV